MNIGHDNGSPGSGSSSNGPDARDFDATLRRLHAQAVEHVPARTLMQLRPQRATTAATKPRLFAWPLAATCAIALVPVGTPPASNDRADREPGRGPAAVAADPRPGCL